MSTPSGTTAWDDGERDMKTVRAHYFQAGRDVPGFIFSGNG
ncbi:hypothetical protein [Deinococcus frigens]|nr:hypothetical protein [Deinococcus frigens]